MQAIVVIMGGNALARQGEHGIYRPGYRVLVTHGNGPQVGSLAIAQEEGSRLRLLSRCR